MISPTWHSPGCGWLHWRGIATGLFGSLFVSLLGGEREWEREKEREKVETPRRRVSVSCQSSQMREDVQNKLFHSDELKIIPVHLQTFAVEVANPENKAHL